EVGFRNDYSSPSSLLLEPDGGALVGGTVGVLGGPPTNEFSDDFAVARFKPDWTLDQTFGHAGWALTGIRPQSWDTVTSLARLDDKLTAVGTTAPTGQSATDLAVARYLLAPLRCTPPTVR